MMSHGGLGVSIRHYSRDLLLKQWDRYPRSTERISCLFYFCTEFFVSLLAENLYIFTGFDQYFIFKLKSKLNIFNVNK